MKAAVFTVTSLFKLSDYSFSPEWFADFGLPKDMKGLNRVVVGNIVYLIEDGMDDENKPIVVFNLTGDEKVLDDKPISSHAFERVITVVRSIFTNTVMIPNTWRPHREGSLWSFYGAHKEVGAGTRIHADVRVGGDRDVFVYARTKSTLEFEKVPCNRELYDAAKGSYTEAIIAAMDVKERDQDQTLAGIVLTERLPQGFVPDVNLNELYENKLTSKQREFVDKPYDGPVRLRGSAGTGKTLSLVVKFLRDGIRFESEKQNMNLGFLTHSDVTVELVQKIASNFDWMGLMSGVGKHCSLQIRTLYDLAHEHLHFDMDNLEPLSLDGREGRRLQKELIEMVLDEMRESPVMRAKFGDISPEIKARWEAVSREDKERFVNDISNEFGSVLDADGIRAGEERGVNYAKGTGRRAVWLMPLPLVEDRRFILEVHRRYRLHLGEMNTLSVDQMIADFNSLLESNRWDRIRDLKGYDGLFVDEFHLFTSVERQILHKLIKHSETDNGETKRPPIFMAYDLKQSPRDTFTQYGERKRVLFTTATGLQNAKLVELSTVFRYTPEIAKFLGDLDSSFPAFDIPGEWNAYSGKAQLQNGESPKLDVFTKEVYLFQSIFKEAGRTARQAKGGGRRVAVLCSNEKIFDEYLRIAEGQFKGKFVPIKSRDQFFDFRHAGKRFIFSMPEYVAGLQFETVFLMHVDAEEAPSDANINEQRQFISNVYLGSSRAEKNLRISTCESRGGPSHILDFALKRKSLERSPPRPASGADRSVS